MQNAAALRIIQQLANGIDPHTGEIFRADSTYQHPDTVRALFLAARALEVPEPAAAAPAAGATTGTKTGTTTKRAAAESAPPKAGKPWSAEEDQALAAAFDEGRQLPELATAHQRSRFAIETRLAKLGKIAPPANMRFKAASDSAAYVVTH